MFEGDHTRRETPGPIPNPEVKSLWEWFGPALCGGACQMLPSLFVILLFFLIIVKPILLHQAKVCTTPAGVSADWLHFL